MNISELLKTEMVKVQYQNVKPFSDEVISEIINILRNCDMDLVPLLEIFAFCLDSIQDQKLKTVIVYHILKFYGIIGNEPVLKTRQMFKIVGNELVKTPFLKETDKKYINTLLNDLGIII